MKIEDVPQLLFKIHMAVVELYPIKGFERVYLTPREKFMKIIGTYTISSISLCTPCTIYILFNSNFKK